MPNLILSSPFAYVEQPWTNINPKIKQNFTFLETRTFRPRVYSLWKNHSVLDISKLMICWTLSGVVSKDQPKAPTHCTKQSENSLINCPVWRRQTVHSSNHRPQPSSPTCVNYLQPTSQVADKWFYSFSSHKILFSACFPSLRSVQCAKCYPVPYWLLNCDPSFPTLLGFLLIKSRQQPAVSG